MSFFHGTRGDWHFMAKAPIYDDVKGHSGEDYLMPENTPIPSPIGGVVLAYREQVEMGHCLYIQEANGNIHVFAHLNASMFEKDATVSRGEIIALSGHTGTRAGSVPHLHYEIMAPKPWPGLEFMTRTLAPYSGYNIPPEDYLNQLAMPKTSPEIEWLRKNEFIFGTHQPNDPMTWGECAIVLKRIFLYLNKPKHGKKQEAKEKNLLDHGGLKAED